MRSITLFKNLTVLTIVFLLFSCSKKERVDFGYITFYYGDVKVKQAGALLSTAPKLKMMVKSGDTIYSKENSRVDVQLQNFGLIRINQNSEIELEKVISKANESINLDMNKGQILCKLIKLNKDQKFSVETPTAVAGVRGTTFLVDAENKKQSEVAVENGSVEVANKKEPEKKVVVGENETAKVGAKSGLIDKVKGIDAKKLTEFKGIKDVAILKNVKNVDLSTLKNLSFKNLKSLNIKDLKGLGGEFKNLIPGKSAPSKSASSDSASQGPSQIDNAKAKVDEQKQNLENKKKELEEQKKKAAESAKEAQEKVKNNLKKFKF